MRLKELYKKEIVPAMQKKFGYKNKMAVPKISKVVLNVGLGRGLKDKKYEELVENTLVRITGQKPVKTKAKKSISNFKIREGMVVGMKVTLRGNRMYDFMDKLVNITFPRVRDFRGISPKAVDKMGNLSLGFKENIAFPEIQSDEVDTLHPLEVVITTTSKSREEGLELLTLIGLPFKQ